jgi:hypothetical protein
MVVLRSELNDKLSIEKWAKWKVPKEVRVAKIKEAIHNPQRNPITHIWHGNELLICKAFWETTLSRVNLWWFNGSIFFTLFLYAWAWVIILPNTTLKKKNKTMTWI